MYLLRRKYLSSAVNALKNCPKILHITKRHVFRLNSLHSDQKIWQRCWGADFNSVWDRLPCLLLKGLLKWDFLAICLTTSFAVCNFPSAIFECLLRVLSMSAIFDFKCSKFNSTSKNAQNKSEKFCYFLDKCMWIDCFKLPLLSIEYFSSAVNVVTNSTEILHIIKRDFSRLNCLHSDW